jgi:hypothetical protein
LGSELYSFKEGDIIDVIVKLKSGLLIFNFVDVKECQCSRMEHKR